MKKLIFTIMILAACSGKDDPSPSSIGEPVPSVLYQRHVTEFYIEAGKRGKNPISITPAVRFTNNSEFTKRCDSALSRKVSLSYVKDGEYIIEITDGFKVYQNDMQFLAPIYRELAHLTLNKPYEDLEFTNSSENIMCQCTDNINSERSIDNLFK
jgi:hypothetical protein